MPFVEFGDSDAAKVGDWVLAIGNPLGQGFSVSAGIVSARNRTLQGSYDDFIQTDAAINRGNSGGPLFDMQGRVIGVNTAILSPNGGSIGIGFAMSAAVVSNVVDQLRDFGETRRGWLGVRIQNVDEDVADAIGLKAAKGALVTDVPEGPALKAGLKSGDVVLRFGGEEIDDTRELVRVVADTPVGETVDVVVFRDGKEETLKVEVGLLEEATLAAAPGEPPADTPAGARGDRARHDRRRHQRRDPPALRPRPRGQRPHRHRARRHLRRLRQGHARGRRDRRGRPGAGRRARRRCGAASRRPRRPAATRSSSSSAATASRASWR